MGMAPGERLRVGVRGRGRQLFSVEKETVTSEMQQNLSLPEACGEQMISMTLEWLVKCESLEEVYFNKIR